MKDEGGELKERRKSRGEWVKEGRRKGVKREVIEGWKKGK